MARKQYRIFRDDQVHVNLTLCRTCIYRPEPSIPVATRDLLEQQANEDSAAIVCHETMDTRKPTVCRGYYEINQSVLLRLADAMGVTVFDPVP